MSTVRRLAPWLLLLDEPLPTRLGLPLHGAGASAVAWSDPVDPRALGLYGDEVGGAEAE